MELGFKCPGCGGELAYNLRTGKYHCVCCRRMWTYEIDFERKKIIYHEWKSLDKGEPLYDFIMGCIEFDKL